MRDLVVEAELGERRGAVSPTDDRDRVGRGDGLGDRARAGGERRQLEGAHRPVPEHRARRRDLGGVQLGGLRADVEAHEPLGHVDLVALDRLGVGRELLAEHVVDRQAQLVAALLERAARGLDALGLAERGADLVALGLKERVAHRAADEDRVGDLEEGVDDADLVGHLGAADDRHERAAGIVEDPRQRLDLALQQAAGGRVVDVLDDADGRGVRAVRGAERVVDVEVRERAEARRQLGVVLRLARLEADVLEHHDVAVGHVVEVRRERDLGAEQAGEVLGDRRERELRLAVLRPAEVRDEQQPRAALAQLLDRRQRGADAGIVGDRAVRQRDVEVDADEAALTGDVAEVVERPHAT